MPEFAAYYAGVECGNEYARAPHTVTFKHLGKTHIYAVTIEAATPDDAFAQLQVHRMTSQTAQDISKCVSRLTMIPEPSRLSRRALFLRGWSSWVSRSSTHLRSESGLCGWFSSSRASMNRSGRLSLVSRRRLVAPRRLSVSG